MEATAATEARRAVLLDALGTLIELEPPSPRLVAELRERWDVEITEAEARRAFGEEIDYYREHHLEGSDPPALNGLRHRCAAILHRALPPEARARVPVFELVPAMLASLRFRPYPEVPEALAALRAAGLRLAVVSNWDISLHEALEQAGLAADIEWVVTSARVGAAKPGRLVFERALALLGVEAGEAIHVGDSPGLDDSGALAAGVEPVLVLRDPDARRAYAGPAPVLARLDAAALLALAGSA